MFGTSRSADGTLSSYFGAAVAKKRLEWIGLPAGFLPSTSSDDTAHHLVVRLYAGQDTRALLDVGLHKSPRMVERYTHLEVGEEARKADLLPVPDRSVK